MDIADVIRDLEQIAPPDRAEEMDAGRIGLIVEGRHDVRKVACALDVTLPVVRAAVAMDAGLLVVHHTPLWTPVTAVLGPLAVLLQKILSADLNVYVMHTNFDHADGGINDALASLLELSGTSRMSLGICGDCPLPLPEIARRLGSPLITWGNPSLPCRIGVVGGSGFDLSLIGEAVSLGAEAFLSADLKHAQARASPIPLLQGTHYALEAPGMRMLAARMGWEFIDDPPVTAVWT
ncbi:MAG: Nif3-like dinuclear metal center hexameric protein [Methanomicrobiales archaeon]|nr:Nif3-like dinuclear metal center hexameric protein [Methanomicrobiales archaeon]NYT20640.1 Nif3-like dinuclear metal center hexameric protein [Methanomicrobiales archaeon]